MWSAGTTPEKQALREMLENREWLDVNLRDIQKEHPDRWILVLDRHLAAVAAEVDEVRKEAGGREAAAIIMRVPSGPIETPI